MLTRGLWLMIALGVALDHASKYWAQHTLSFYTGKPVIGDLLAFQLVHNYGAAYGIFQNQRLFLLIVGFFVLGACLYFRAQIAHNRLTSYGLSFLLIGTFGNLGDRVFRGYVVDFINIHILPVFNIADMTINIGIACFILDIIMHRDANKA